MRISAPLLVALCGLSLPGCSPYSPASPNAAEEPAAHSSARRHNDKIVDESSAGALPSNTNKKGRRAAHELEEDWLPPLRTAGGTADGGGVSAPWSRGVPFTETQALGGIERELEDALRVRPTLVVWLFDQSAAAGTLRRAAASAAVQMAARFGDESSAKEAAGASGAPANKLLTAMVAFGSKVNVLTPQPIAEPQKLPQPQAIAEESAAATQTYAAVIKAAELFAPYRFRGHDVIFVLAANGASADEAHFASAVATLTKAAIPVFGIGPAVPFGRLADALTANIQPLDAALGHESLHAERIKLFFPGNEGDVELVDSGYGPFHLERLCRATKGDFLRLLPGGSAGWKTDDNGKVPAKLLRRYAPDYVTEEEYRKILAENRACQALHEAAQLPPARVLIPPSYEFLKEEEDAMSRALSERQRASAENQTALERLHQTLAAGADDRPKLKHPRWQAAFDLGYGRACAARARNEGYNHMLALLKIGKPFANPQSTTWILKETDTIAGGSDLDAIARNAKMYLQRVVKEHAGTPWAAMAARELETPCGWEWTER